MRLKCFLFFLFSFFVSYADSPGFFIDGNNGRSVFFKENTLSFVFREPGHRFRIDIELPGFSVSELTKSKERFYSGKDKYSMADELTLTNGSATIHLEKIQDKFVLDVSRSGLLRAYVHGAEAIFYTPSISGFISNGTILPVEFKSQGRGDNKSAILAQLFNIPVIDGSIASGSWSTFEGGNNDDNIISVTRAGSSVIVCGSTLSTDLPVSPGAYSDSTAGYYDVFVTSYALNGNKKWSTYFGGNNLDLPAKILDDSAGNVYFSGYTSSPNFPVIGNPVQDSLKGGYDVFIAKLDSTGQPLYSGFFGGSAADFGYAMTLDKYGDLIIGGGTTSTDLPTSPTSAQQVFAGAVDAFAVKLNSSFQVIWCTYYGGAGSEDMHAMCSDDSSSVVFSGGTFSPDFPTANGFQMTSNGSMETYVVKLNTNGALQWSTYFGGTANDDSYGVVTDAQRNVYITGSTQSQGLPFSGSFQDTLRGSYDSYILKLSPSGSFLGGTYIGGSSSDANAVCDLKDGILFLAGTTMSTDLVVDTQAFQQGNNGSSDGFYALFDTTLQYLHSGYFGGIFAETVTSVIADTGRSFFVAGKTTSPSLPFVFAGEQTVKAGGEDGFLALFDPASGLVSSGNIEKARSGLIYPVPFRDVLYVESGMSKGSVHLYDVSGRMILESNFENKSVLDTSSLKQGTYLLTVRTQEGVISRKVIKL